MLMAEHGKCVGGEVTSVNGSVANAMEGSALEIASPAGGTLPAEVRSHNHQNRSSMSAPVLTSTCRPLVDLNTPYTFLSEVQLPKITSISTNKAQCVMRLKPHSSMVPTLLSYFVLTMLFICCGTNIHKVYTARSTMVHHTSSPCTGSWQEA